MSEHPSQAKKSRFHKFSLRNVGNQNEAHYLEVGSAEKRVMLLLSGVRVGLNIVSVLVIDFTGVFWYTRASSSLGNFAATSSSSTSSIFSSLRTSACASSTSRSSSNLGPSPSTPSAKSPRLPASALPVSFTLPFPALLCRFISP
ncbi:hypothetical protein GOP47_0015889 [Adiantum capillus-veneris]|uniref:Transmembrane protein n=1 Tax=Adiantum capillus-veneris TaxID=13818 RepID=A0A9D4ULN5_ADICA|nr:hypothetical protein GOP47_0015889 [Adiantum capillus-veneris]